MRVLILGASGLIGGNLLHHLRDELNWNVVGTYFSYKTKGCVFFNTLNLEDEQNFNLEKFNPEVVVHCGALTWVDYCEDHEEESYEKTVLSTKNALQIANDFDAKFVYISTDYIFDGRSGPYREEEEESNPLNIYGRHKLEAEKEVVDHSTSYVIGRVTNVYGNEERGKNFISRLISLAQSEKKESLSLPIDQYATPVNAYDVARVITKLIIHRKEGIYNIASTDYVNRYQLASMVLKKFPQNNIDMLPVLTTDLKQKAERPLRGGLISEKFLNEFPDFQFTNVCDYINETTKE